MNHVSHSGHTHAHNEHCGHVAIRHNGHTDYIHDGHLHTSHEGHYDEHVIEVNAHNPAECKTVSCACGHDNCGHVQVPHGDHEDYLFEGHLHHRHGDHCDDHGSVQTV